MSTGTPPPPPTIEDLARTHPFFYQPNRVIWIYFCDYVRDELGRGRSFYFAILNCIAARLFKNSNGLRVRLSPQHLIDAMYYHCNVVSGVSDHVLSFLEQVGVCLESKRPYNGLPNPVGNDGREIIPEGPFVKIRGFEELHGSFEFICDHIFKEGPIVAEINGTEYFKNFKGEAIYKTPPDEGWKQTVSVIGYDSRFRLYLIQNSMGDLSGFHGFMWVPESDLSNFGYPIMPYLYHF